jgi:hypothetical protein
VSRRIITAALVLAWAVVAGIAAGGTTPEMHDFARSYTIAWCGQNPAAVAAFFAENGSLTINQGKPAVGRAAIEAAVSAYMTAFPDHVLWFDKLDERDGRVLFHWTFEGTNSGPGGTGNRVRFSGSEAWLIGNDDLIQESEGTYDEADYQRQLQGD